jgi:hypothetical protein
MLEVFDDTFTPFPVIVTPSLLSIALAALLPLALTLAGDDLELGLNVTESCVCDLT